MKLMLRMQPTVFYRKKLEISIVTQEKNKSCPETIRARTRDACPEILAARLRGSFQPFNDDPQNPPS
jgi:hypothetical protein